MAKKLTLANFIKNAKEIHGNKYDYSQVIYINSRTKVKIYCKNVKDILNNYLLYIVAVMDVNTVEQKELLHYNAQIQ